MAKDVTVLFGAPGCGKTTYLIGVVEQLISQGVPPERIAFTSFSRKAAYQAQAKAMEKFGLTEESFPWFRTLHSVAYRLLELGRHDVMTNAHFKELGAAIGVTFRGVYDVHVNTNYIPIDVSSVGDRCLALYARAKARGWSLEDEWRYANDWDLPWAMVQGFASHLDSYKRDRGVVDFTDMIDMADEPLPIDVMIVDEAQDLSPQQWAAARRFGAHATQVFVAGDDDQAIYNFSGATATPLLTLRGTRVVLPHSYRLPRTIKAVADKVSANIKRREPKTFSARDEDGAVTWLREADDVDLSQGTWLLLCRNRAQLERLEELARRQNVVYYLDGEWSNNSEAIRAVVAYERIRRGAMITSMDAHLIKSFLIRLEIPKGQDKFHDWTELGWPFEGKPEWMDALEISGEEREYIRGIRRRGESLTQPGRVVLSTVHGAKGGEAENVLLLTDISGRVAKGALTRPDDEYRVAYVGVSRASHNLFLVQPTTRNFWSI